MGFKCMENPLVEDIRPDNFFSFPVYARKYFLIHVKRFNERERDNNVAKWPHGNVPRRPLLDECITKQKSES